MSKFCIALAVFCLLFSACNSSSKSQTYSSDLPPMVKQVEWQETVSEEGKFKILFPNTVRQTFKEVNAPSGKVKTQIFYATSEGDSFEVRYGDFPAEPDVDRNDLRPYYNFIRDNTVKLQKSTLLSERDVFLNKNLGRELVLKLDETCSIDRFFLIGNRMYQASVKTEMSRKDNPQTQERANKFLDSFQMLEK